MSKSQCDIVAEYVEEHGSINADQAVLLGVRRLAARVYDLKGSRRALMVGSTDGDGLATYVPDTKTRAYYYRGEVVMGLNLFRNSPADTAAMLHRSSGLFAELALQEQQ